MKLTNRQIVDSIAAIQALNVLKLPVKASFRIAKTARTIDEVLVDYNETMRKLREEYAEKDEDGKIKVDGDIIVFHDMDGFMKAREELLGIETEVNIKKVDLDDFGGVEIEPSVLSSITWLIND